MTGFTSGKISHDPKPYVTGDPRTLGLRRVSSEQARTLSSVTYAPRPDFDNHNPILVDFRRLMGEIIQTGNGTESPAQAAWWLKLLSEPDDVKRARSGFDYPHTRKHRSHAMRVLAKLAALS